MPKNLLKYNLFKNTIKLNSDSKLKRNMSLLIKNIILAGQKKDIFIEGNKIKKIGKKINLRAKEKIDGKGKKAVLPGLINCHTHSAMSLFRGWADDLPLKEWLKKKIWVKEAKLTENDVYWGTKLALLEMIKTGTTCFNEMYWYPEAQIKATEEMGLRAKIGLIMVDFSPLGQKKEVEKLYQNLISKKSETIELAVAPHSIYTVSKENLIWAKNFAKKNNLILHLHLSETEEEVKSCQRKYKLRPVEYLEKIKFLGENCVLAHSIWLSENEIKILAQRKCNLVYNPCSNLKLASGIFPYKKVKEEKINICLGTDSVASNNNLDMFEEMKFAALLQKMNEKDPKIAPASEIFEIATKNGAQALRLDAGEVNEGKLADLILIDLDQVYFNPGHNFISDIVYSANGNCVSDVVCNGKILMEERKIENETKIKKEVMKIIRKL